MTRLNLDRSRIIKQAHNRSERRRRLRQIIWLVLLLIFLGELYWLAHWDKLLLRVVSVTGASPVNMEKIEVLADEILRGDYLGFLPRRNIFFYPRSTLSNTLATNLPILGEIKLSRVNNDLLVAVTEREPHYLWCGETDGDCFLLDETGFAFARAPEFSGHPLFEIQSSLPTEVIGARPLNPDNFQKLLDLKHSLADSLTGSIITGLPKRAILTEDGGLRFLLDHGMVIILSLKTEPLTLSSNLKAVLIAPAFLKEYEDNKKAGQRLDYLDLRFTGKIFYKFSAEPNV